MTGAITPFKYYQTSGKVDRVVIHTYTQVPVHTVNTISWRVIKMITNLLSTGRQRTSSLCLAEKANTYSILGKEKSAMDCLIGIFKLPGCTSCWNQLQLITMSALQRGERKSAGKWRRIWPTMLRSDWGRRKMPLPSRMGQGFVKWPSPNSIPRGCSLVGKFKYTYLHKRNLSQNHT